MLICHRKTWSENQHQSSRAVEASWKIWDPGPKKQAFLFPAVLDGEICLQTSVHGCHLMLETMLFLIQKRRTKPAAFCPPMNLMNHRNCDSNFSIPIKSPDTRGKNHSHFPISRGTCDQFRWPTRALQAAKELSTAH